MLETSGAPALRIVLTFAPRWGGQLMNETLSKEEIQKLEKKEFDQWR
jgi:hypothetical protein